MPVHGGLGLDGFNKLTDRQAVQVLFGVCSSNIWARRVVADRPYRTREALLDKADRVLAELAEAEIDHALDGHPRIGGKVDNASSATEQAAVSTAGGDVLAALSEGNRMYEEKFGHVYLVCAFGRPAEELLDILNDRLDNDADTERRVMRTELMKINRLRLDRILGQEDQT